MLVPGWLHGDAMWSRYGSSSEAQEQLIWWWDLSQQFAKFISRADLEELEVSYTFWKAASSECEFRRSGSVHYQQAQAVSKNVALNKKRPNTLEELVRNLKDTRRMLVFFFIQQILTNARRVHVIMEARVWTKWEAFTVCVARGLKGNFVNEVTWLWN